MLHNSPFESFNQALDHMEAAVGALNAASLPSVRALLGLVVRPI